MFPPDQTEAAFRAMHPDRIETLQPAQGFELMIRFFERDRPEGAVPMDEDGDMLLYEWGTYDWGQGPQFWLSLRRQIIYPDGPDDTEIWQLGLIYAYPKSAELDALDRGSLWCGSPAGIADFEGKTYVSPALVSCQTLSPAAVTVEWERQ